MATKSADTPCNGCTECCKNEVIALLPQNGDVMENYDYTTIIDPRNGAEIFMIKRQDNGACIYLGEKGCTIYEKRPLICRVYDCRKFYLSLTEEDRRIMLRNNPEHANEFNAAKKRLNTLSHEDRQQAIALRNARNKP